MTYFSICLISLFKCLIELLMDMDSWRHCFRKIKLGFSRLSTSFPTSEEAESCNKESSNRDLRANRSEMLLPELPTISPSAS